MAHQIKQTVVRITELHRHLGRVIRKVALSDEHLVVEKGGLPVVVLLSMAEYRRLVGDSRLEEFERHARALGAEVARKGLSEEDVEAKVENIRERLYRENYGRQER